MTQRPHIDRAELERMRFASAAAVACASCPPRTRRTTRRTASGALEVRCVGCGQVLSDHGAPANAPRDLPE